MMNNLTGYLTTFATKLIGEVDGDIEKLYLTGAAHIRLKQTLNASLQASGIRPAGRWRISCSRTLKTAP